MIDRSPAAQDAPPTGRVQPRVLAGNLHHQTGFARQPAIDRWANRAATAEDFHMLMNLLFGIPVMLLCLVFQAIFITIGLREYSLRVQQVERLQSAAFKIWLLALVMFLMLL